MGNARPPQQTTDVTTSGLVRNWVLSDRGPHMVINAFKRLSETREVRNKERDKEIDKEAHRETSIEIRRKRR